MSDTYHIWTMQIARWRLAAECDIAVLDTTAKSGISAFAPHFNDVMRYKDGFLSEEQYTLIYNTKMRESLHDNPQVWKKLLEHKRVAIACYCGAGQFCHRHLFLPYMVEYLKEQGHTVELKGELKGKPAPATPPVVVSAKIPDPGMLFFFGAEHPFSNWNVETPLTLKGITFLHGEQAMMYCKAKLMGDHATAEMILKTPTQWGCKALGKKVTPFDQQLWDEKCIAIVTRICLQKAKEHPHVAKLLIDSGNKVIVEASKYDAVWGVGMDENDPRIHDQATWLGLNNLGICWMNVRRLLQNEVVF